MFIELPIRMADDFTPEEITLFNEELKMKKVTSADAEVDDEEFWRLKRRYVYIPMVMEVDAVIPFSKYDEEHTILNYGGDSYFTKIKYDHFKAIFESITCSKIRTIAEFQIEDEGKKTKTKK